MTKFSRRARGWLNSNLSKEVFEIAFIFGSSAIRYTDPKDCDLLLVTKFEPQDEEWQDVRFGIDELKNEFLKQFQVPLSVQLYSKTEYQEPSYFRSTILK